MAGSDESRAGWFHWINSLASLGSSLATLGAFCFAVWAYNYSSIPEQLTARFNSDIASLNEQITDLRRERRNVADQLSQERDGFQAAMREREKTISHLNETKAQIEADIAQYQMERSQLQVNLDQTRQQNATNQKYRLTYLGDSVSSILGALLAAPVSMEAARLRSTADMARDYPLWLDSQKPISANDEREYSLAERVFQGDMIRIRRIQQEIERRSQLEPDSWVRAKLRRWFRDNQNGEDKSMADVFRAEIAGNTTIITGNDLIEAQLPKAMDIVEKMPANDRRRVQAAVSDYLKRNDEGLRGRLNVFVPMTASGEAVAAEGRRVISNLDRFSQILSGMGEAVAKHVREGS